MAPYNDPSYSAATHDGLKAADAALDTFVETIRRGAPAPENDDEANALIAQTVGGILIGCTAAVCSAVADVATALRERPVA